MTTSKIYAGLFTFIAFTFLNIVSGVDGESHEGTPILCYSCNSEYDPRCGDPFDPFSIGIINCSLKEPLEHLPKQKPTMCRKNVQRIYGKTRVVRGCGYIEDEYKDAKCLYRSGTFNVNAAYCSCSGNLCNSSPSLPPATILALLLTALLATLTAFL